MSSDKSDDRNEPEYALFQVVTALIRRLCISRNAKGFWFEFGGRSELGRDGDY